MLNYQLRLFHICFCKCCNCKRRDLKDKEECKICRSLIEDWTYKEGTTNLDPSRPLERPRHNGSSSRRHRKIHGCQHIVQIGRLSSGQWSSDDIDGKSSHFDCRPMKIIHERICDNYFLILFNYLVGNTCGYIRQILFGYGLRCPNQVIRIMSMMVDMSSSLRRSIFLFLVGIVTATSSFFI